jgi:hypothetical protein
MSLLCILNPIITSSNKKKWALSSSKWAFSMETITHDNRETVKSNVFWDMLFCSLVKFCPCFRETYWLHLHSWRINKQTNSAYDWFTAYKSILQPWRQGQYIPLNCS